MLNHLVLIVILLLSSSVSMADFRPWERFRFDDPNNTFSYHRAMGLTDSYLYDEFIEHASFKVADSETAVTFYIEESDIDRFKSICNGCTESTYENLNLGMALGPNFPFVGDFINGNVQLGVGIDTVSRYTITHFNGVISRKRDKTFTNGHVKLIVGKEFYLGILSLGVEAQYRINSFGDSGIVIDPS